MASNDPLRTENERGIEYRRNWSIHEASPLLAKGTTTVPHFVSERRQRVPLGKDVSEESEEPVKEKTPGRNKDASTRGNFVLYIIYAIVNVIIAVPGLYGTL